MNIFISWSGDRAKSVATALRTFLFRVNRQWRPWVSHLDIAAGTRWRAELDKSLDAATSAVVCLTPAGLSSPWVQFETGALSASPLCARICPYLIDLEQEKMSGPLSEFQSRQANEEGSWDLLVALNHVLAEPIGESALRSRFVKCWSSLKADIASSPAEHARSYAQTYNKLDSVGLQSLLQIHFSASANRLTHVFNQGLEEFSDDPSKLNFDLLVINATRVLDEGRHLLAPFSSDVTGPLPTFLDECLPSNELGERLRRGLEIVSKYPQAQRRKVAAYQLIQEEQARLMRIIRGRLGLT
jgi:hypothetical protein